MKQKERLDEKMKQERTEPDHHRKIIIKGISWDLRLYEKTSVKNGMTGNWICVLVRVLMRLNWRSSQSRTRLSA